MSGYSAQDFQKHLDQAVALKEKITEGERMFIEAAEANAGNDPQKALKINQQLTEIFPNDKRAHLNLAFSYGGRNNYEKQIESLNRVLEIDPEFSNAYNILGYTYIAANETGKAEEAFKNYINAAPEEANPYDSYADLLTKMGRFEEAAENFKKAIDLNSEFDFSQQKIGNSLVFMAPMYNYVAVR